MEAFSYAARGNLRRLLQLHPGWTRAQLAQATGMSLSWVDKWKKRLTSAPLEDEQVLRGLSRAPHHPPPQLDSLVVDRLLDIGDERTFGLGRTPGPKAILYYLARDESLQQAGLRLPRSTRPIHRLLREQGRIAPRLPHLSEPMERPKPMQRWQLDAHSMPPASPQIQRASSNTSSRPSTSSIWGLRCSLPATCAPISRQKPRGLDVAHTFQEHGLPASITLDRDTRWVGAPQGSDFPAALIRFCHSIGVAVLVCEPHHPQQHGFVERYHRTSQEECLSRHRPTTLEQVREVTESFSEHYNWQRPHQGLSCGNQPPRMAFPTLPSLPKYAPTPVEPPAGAIVNHFGFTVKDMPAALAKWKAANLTIDPTENPNEVYVNAPDGIRLEVYGEPALPTPVSMNHIHYNAPDIPGIKAWYVKAFGANARARGSAAFPVRP